MKDAQGFPLKRGKEWELLEAEYTLKLESVLKTSDVCMSTNRRKINDRQKKEKTKGMFLNEQGGVRYSTQVERLGCLRACRSLTNS